MVGSCSAIPGAMALLAQDQSTRLFAEEIPHGYTRPLRHLHRSGQWWVLHPRMDSGPAMFTDPVGGSRTAFDCAVSRGGPLIGSAAAW
jgi:hypothetical protein